MEKASKLANEWSTVSFQSMTVFCLSSIDGSVSDELASCMHCLDPTSIDRIRAGLPYWISIARFSLVIILADLIQEQVALH